MALRSAALTGAIAWLTLVAAGAQSPPEGRRDLPYADARAVFDALGEAPPAPAAWPAVIAGIDRDIRARIAAGDETSVVNLLLFGTSFTAEPRITAGEVAGRDLDAAVGRRLRDFERALASPGAGERLLYARRVVGEGEVAPRLRGMLGRVMEEGERHAQLLEAAHALGDPSLEFAERSRIYRARGLAPDTSFRTNLALEEAMARLRADGVIASPLARIAIVGPGLDVVDKQEGYDFYPPQTIQPFAVVDTVLRLGLAREGDLQVTTFDVSRRVNDHLARARREAARGASYLIQLPLDARVSWSPALTGYWRAFGDRIGGAGAAASVPAAAGPVRVRAVRVRPSVTRRITALDVNVVAQHVERTAAERFDVVVATNVFVYYDRLQQALAMANLARMVRPGGILLSNNALLEVPSTGWRSIGYSKTVYSARDEDGDTVVWYQLTAG